MGQIHRRALELPLHIEIRVELRELARLGLRNVQSKAVVEAPTTNRLLQVSSRSEAYAALQVLKAGVRPQWIKVRKKMDAF